MRGEGLHEVLLDLPETLHSRAELHLELGRFLHLPGLAEREELLGPRADGLLEGGELLVELVAVRRVAEH